MSLSDKNKFEFEIRNIGGSDVYYKRNFGDKLWLFSTKEEFERKIGIMYKGYTKSDIEKGAEIEMEHKKTIENFMKDGTNVKEVAKAIAIDHLEENPLSYSDYKGVCMNESLMIRLFELMNEDIKSDVDLHKVAEKVISASKNKDILTMDDYESFLLNTPKEESYSIGGGVEQKENSNKIECHNPNCNWSWSVESGGDDLYVCHKCHTDNEKFYEKGGLIAPNGKPSNLTPEQYKLVRSEEFKKWFGDWEKDPANASKVVDKNGEPLICYHGSNNAKINRFDVEKAGSVQYSDWGQGIYFTPSKHTADYYSNEALKKIDSEYNRLYEVYEKTQDFVDLKAFQNRGMELFGNKNTIVYSVFLNIKKPRIEVVDSMNYTDPFLSKNAKMDNRDGVFIKNSSDMLDEVIAFEPNQIKLADGTNTTFDGNNPDIRFEDGGEVEDLINQGIIELKMFATKPEHAKEYGLDSVNPLFVQSLNVNENKRLKGVGKKVLQYIDDYAIKNGHDVVFGHINKKATMKKDNRTGYFTEFTDIDFIKHWLFRNGYNVNRETNDFYKVIASDSKDINDESKSDIHFADGGRVEKEISFEEVKKLINSKEYVKVGQSFVENRKAIYKISPNGNIDEIEHNPKFFGGVSYKTIARKKKFEDGGKIQLNSNKGKVNLKLSSYEDVTELVPVSELLKLREFDRNERPKYSLEDSNDNISKLEKALVENGVEEPLIIEYSLEDNSVLLIEGNHRLNVAENLGFDYLPARVVLRRREFAPLQKTKALKVKGFTPDKYGYVPSDLKPSQVGIGGTTKAFEEGGVVEGQLHSECNEETGCGEKYDVGGVGHIIEVERDEAVIVSKAFEDNNQYEIKGTPSEIASALNVLGDGKNFDSGAEIKSEDGKKVEISEIKKEAKNTDVETIDPNSIIINRRSMYDEKEYVAKGTPKQIASQINNLNDNGVKIVDGGSIKKA